MQKIKAFEKLDDQQARSCIDIAVALSILAARLNPWFSKESFRQIYNEWSKASGIDPNQCRYAICDATMALYQHNWKFHVTKEANALICQFIPDPQPELEGGNNGESSQLE